MNRFPKIVLGLLALAIVVAFVTPALAVESKGTIKTVMPDKKEFVSADKDAKDWTFQLEKDGKVLINDKEAKLADLQVGDEVTVIYEKKDDKLMASEVRCMRK
jgi:biopolymer transport protein ExbD